MQDGDVPITFADVNNLIKDYDYSPSTLINEGLEKFIEWFKIYNNLK